MRLFNDYAVSHIIGYLLTLIITAIMVTSFLFATNSIIDNNIKEAADLYAENLANQVADSIVKCYNVKSQYPNSRYINEIEVPLKLINRYEYYIEVENDNVWVRSEDGRIVKNSPLFGISDRILMDITGTVNGQYGKINISCGINDYKYKFDFGPENSLLEYGYVKVSEPPSSPDAWDSDYDYNPSDGAGWKYRIPITINNPIPPSKVLDNYTLFIKLNDSNFDYSLANSDGSDLRFSKSNGDNLNYWIERWNSRDSHVSRIWVNSSTLLFYGENTIYMYFGNQEAKSESNGDLTFLFFDDFSGGDSALNEKWNSYTGAGLIKVVNNDILKIMNGAALISKVKADLPEQCTIWTPHFIMEAKVKSEGTNDREASIFAKAQTGNIPPYETGYVLKSGKFTDDENISIQMYDFLNDEWKKSIDGNIGESVSGNWYRLSLIIYDSDIIGCRYYYDNFSLDGYIYDQDTTYDDPGCVGLCTLENSVTGLFDWVYVRSYERNELATKLEDSYPTTTVGSTYSQVFYWENLNSLNSYSSIGTDVDDDLIYNDKEAAIFTIAGLDSSEKYSFTITCGNKQGLTNEDYLVDDMIVTIDGATSTVIDNINCDPLEKIKVIGVYPDINGEFQIEFHDDKGPPGDYYWAVTQLTIEKGERKITLSPGD